MDIEHVRRELRDADCVLERREIVEDDARPDLEGIDIEEKGRRESYRCEDLAVGAEGEVLEAAAVVGEDPGYGRFWGGCWWDVAWDRLRWYRRGDARAGWGC